MARFSEVFSLNKNQSELDFVDVDLSTDTPLYIDPFAIQIRDDEWSLSCADHIRSFFNELLDAIRDGDTGRSSHLLSNLHEPNETFLGESKGEPSGRAVGEWKGKSLAAAIEKSRAFETGVLADLPDAALYIRNVSRDTISDLATNIIRGLLADYTLEQCALHNVPTQTVNSLGPVWDISRRDWVSKSFELPVFGGRPILLVPKFSVRFRLSLDSQEFYNHHMIEFLRQEYLHSSSALVRVLKDGSKRVYKVDVKERHPFIKDDLATFVLNHPEILESYKDLKGSEGTLSTSEIEKFFDEAAFSKILIERLNSIPKGAASASEFHSVVTGILTFIFHPHLIKPVKEREIHSGRKRLDIKFTNASTRGFFNRMLVSPQTRSISVPVECKNYSADLKNPELDQLRGRFGHTRGFFGMLICRELENRDRVVQGCRDTALDGGGFMLVLDDSDIANLLKYVEAHQRSLIDKYMQDRFDEITH